MSKNNSLQLEEAISYRRRTILASIGAGAGLATVGGSGAYAAESHDDEDDETAGEEDSDRDGDVRSTFGYAAESPSVEPPVEPDHEVSLLAEVRDRGADGAADDDAADDGAADDGDAEGDDAGAEEPAEEMFGLPEWHFDPVGLYIEPGETVKFQLESPFHTISAFHPDLGFTQRVPDGVGAISSPVLWEGAYFLYTFDEPGVYDLMCLPHEWAGMVIRIVVGEATGPGAEEIPEPEFADGMPNPDEPSPPDWLAATVLRDAALDPENIIDQGSVGWGDLDDESKEFPFDMFDFDEFEEEDGKSLVAVLSETDGGPSTDASGCAHFSETEAGLEFNVVLENIESVTQAHVHEGGRSEDGPVVAPLFAYTDGADGSGEGEPADADPDSPLFDSGVIDDTEVVDAILADPSGYYVNVHTTENPAGEIRGQIRREMAVEEPDEPVDPDDEDQSDGDQSDDDQPDESDEPSGSDDDGGTDDSGTDDDDTDYSFGL